MAFKEISDLSCETTISLGGMNKKTGKLNPTQIQGYYLGSRTVEDKKKKSGISYIYAIQTPKGNVGVWGKTDLDRKMTAVSPGSMIRVTQSGTVPTPNGDMYKFKVEVDSENTIEVAAPVEKEQAAEAFSSNTDDEAYGEEASVEDDVDALDEVQPARPVAPRRPAPAPNAASASAVQALLNKNRPKAS